MCLDLQYTCFWKAVAERERKVSELEEALARKNAEESDRLLSHAEKVHDLTAKVTPSPCALNQGSSFRQNPGAHSCIYERKRQNLVGCVALNMNKIWKE